MSTMESATESVRNAAETVRETAADLQARGQEVTEQAQDVAGSLKAAIDDSIRMRPYTTLLVAGFLGFLYGAMRRR